MDLLKKYYKKLAVFGLIKSLIIGVTIAAFTVLVMGFVFWLVGFKGVWIGVGSFFAVTAIATAILYFVKFRPDEKEIAKKLDECGLEERMITMNELKDSDTFIARKQREDALNVLKNFNSAVLKFSIATVAIVLCAVSVVCGTGSITVMALIQTDVIKDSGIDIVKPDDEKKEKTYEVTYDVLQGEGYIDGNIYQIIEEGKDGESVTAVADDGYVFVCWVVNGEQTEDTDPYRNEVNVTEKLTITAIFQEAQAGEGSGEGEGDGDGDGEGEGAGEGAEGKPGEGEGQGQGKGQGDGDGDGEGGGAGGKHEETNQVIDGETYYGDSTYSNAYNDAVGEMSGSGNTDGDREIGSDYFDAIKK